jgi:hypothetical protein
MTAHLNLPYNWAECFAPESCEKSLHSDETSAALNSYPYEWVQEFIDCEITDKAIRFYDENRRNHRADGPAAESVDGYTAWWFHGKLHRENGPAVRHGSGAQEWWVNGEPHRVGGPAIVRSDGSEDWYINGKLHREDGPAIVNADGTQEWWVNGELHRENGPAVANNDGEDEWWFHGFKQAPSRQIT